ncbi:hypothetical protein NHP21005_17850 [Helicobacter sp. NHP21005]|uniref:hypothetical protein n=1 Tax=Helicobacter felistomachi TaxID=3040201 RepID=UPI0025729A8F|nr:hypothetical protein [Helicobacter sp. NHP21005]BEG58097.1 hypothetical protein NHP21005_17850 [Helicobacter sp. NHP21005]
MPTGLERAFCEWCADKIDAYTEALFFDHQVSFFKQIFAMQQQFLQENTNFWVHVLEWCAKQITPITDSISDKQELINATLKAKQALDKATESLIDRFIALVIDYISEDKQALFFDDRPAFLKLVIRAQAHFFNDHGVFLEDLKATTPQKKAH